MAHGNTYLSLQCHSKLHYTLRIWNMTEVKFSRFVPSETHLSTKPPSDSMPPSHIPGHMMKSEPCANGKLLTITPLVIAGLKRLSTYNNEDPNSVLFTPPKRLKSRSKVSSRMIDTSTSSTPLQPSNRPRGVVIYPTEKTLVLSSDPRSSATDLSASSNSLGANLANISTDHYCKMSDKTLHPVCSPSVTDDCSNLDSLNWSLVG